MLKKARPMFLMIFLSRRYPTAINANIEKNKRQTTISRSSNPNPKLVSVKKELMLDNIVLININAMAIKIVYAPICIKENFSFDFISKPELLFLIFVCFLL